MREHLKSRRRYQSMYAQLHLLFCLCVVVEICPDIYTERHKCAKVQRSVILSGAKNLCI